jgi:hypothetical protein
MRSIKIIITNKKQKLKMKSDYGDGK